MATAAAAKTAPAALPELLSVPTEQLREHPFNTRKNFDPASLAELTASIREKGIQTPLLVRASGKGYEIIGGHRRFRCAKALGLAEVPVLVRKLSDDDALELMLIDNLQREGLHALDEAEGYRQLMTKAKYDVARIAERVGRSVKYVYDRVKLLQLSKEMQQIFRAGEISAGHAIIIARLRPADQKRLLDEDNAGAYYRGGQPPLFEDEETLFDPEDDRAAAPTRKPISVRELQAWCDKHVKLEAAEADPMLFPDTVAALKTAVDEKEKVVRITYDEITPDELKDGPRAILGRSWKRADGKRGSKTCDRSVIGMVVIGPARGEALRVCVDKKGCPVHWKEQQKAAKKRAAEATKTSRATGEDREAVRRRKEKEEQERRDAETARWAKAEPAIISALAKAVKKAPTGVGGALGKLVLATVADSFYGRVALKEAGKHVGPGRTGDDLVRHVGFAALLEALRVHDVEDFRTDAKAFGVDVAKIVDQVAPAAPAEARCRVCGCTEAKACTINIPGEEPRGCSWIEKPDPKTKLGLCCAPKCVRAGRGKKAGNAAKKRKAK